MHRGERLRMPLVEDRAAWLEQLCAGVPGRVAHLGCADSPYTRELLDRGLLLHSRLVSVTDVTGFDVDGPALALLRSAFPGQRFVEADVTAGVPESERGTYDLVLAGEVPEPLPDADARLGRCA